MNKKEVNLSIPDKRFCLHKIMSNLYLCAKQKGNGNGTGDDIIMTQHQSMAEELAQDKRVLRLPQG